MIQIFSLPCMAYLMSAGSIFKGNAEFWLFIFCLFSAGAAIGSVLGYLYAHRLSIDIVTGMKHTAVRKPLFSILAGALIVGFVFSVIGMLSAA